MAWCLEIDGKLQAASLFTSSKGRLLALFSAPNVPFSTCCHHVQAAKELPCFPSQRKEQIVNPGRGESPGREWPKCSWPWPSTQASHSLFFHFIPTSRTGSWLAILPVDPWALPSGRWVYCQCNARSHSSSSPFIFTLRLSNSFTVTIRCCGGSIRPFTGVNGAAAGLYCLNTLLVTLPHCRCLYSTAASRKHQQHRCEAEHLATSSVPSSNTHSLRCNNRSYFCIGIVDASTCALEMPDDEISALNVATTSQSVRHSSPPSHPLRHRLPMRASTLGDVTFPLNRRRSSVFSETLSETQRSLRESADDLLLPRVGASSELDERQHQSHWHSVPLGLALLPAVAGLFFQNGTAVTTDVTLLCLAAIFLNWSVRLPW